MARVPEHRVYRSKFQPPEGATKKDLGRWMQEELRQVTRAIEEISTDTSVFGELPVLMPEDYNVGSNEDDANASAVSDAIDAMIEDTIAEGGAIWFFRGTYPTLRPIVVPSNVGIWGIARGNKPQNESNGGIRSTLGNFDIFDFPQDTKNTFMTNMNIGHTTTVTPTDGVAIDARWLQNSFFLNNVFFNLWNGIDFGVARSVVVQGCYMRGLIATGSGIGPDSADSDNSGFGIYLRSTQTLLDGNVGVENTYYDRDGAGVTIEPSAKGTSVILRDIFINGGAIGEAEDDGAVFENYTSDFTCIWLRGASTVRIERAQVRHAEYGIRVEYAPNISGANRSGSETGVQMCADIRISNGSGEGNLNPYRISGFEKVTLESCQANSSAGVCFDIGDNVNTTYPGMGGGLPVREFGGFARLIDCIALTPREEGYLLRSGMIRLTNCITAGFGLNEEDAIAPGQSQELNVTSTSVTYPIDASTLGTFTVRNDSGTAFRYTVGNSGVTESGGGTLVGANSYVQFTRTGAHTHIAVKTSSGTATGALGPEAAQNSNGVLLRTGCTDGVWIEGGIISYDKSLKDHTPPSQDSLFIQSGVDRVWIRNVDLQGGTVGNNAETTLTEADIRDFIGYDYKFSNYAQFRVNVQTGTSYTLAKKDNGNKISCNNANPVTVTIPTNASVPQPIGAEVEILNLGAGTVTVAAAGGVTLVTNSATIMQGQGGIARKTGTNTWIFTR